MGPDNESDTGTSSPVIIEQGHPTTPSEEASVVASAPEVTEALDKMDPTAADTTAADTNAASTEYCAKQCTSAMPRDPDGGPSHHVDLSSIAASCDTRSLRDWATRVWKSTAQSVKDAWNADWGPTRERLSIHAGWLSDAATVATCVVGALSGAKTVMDFVAGGKEEEKDDGVTLVLNLFDAKALQVASGSSSFKFGDKTGEASSAVSDALAQWLKHKPLMLG